MTGEEKELAKAQIEFFISQFKGAEDVFLHGMCYWLAYILEARFQGGEIIYDPVPGHFMWVYDGTAYDVTGGHEIPQQYETIAAIRLTDPRRYLRLMRDCVLKAD